MKLNAVFTQKESQFQTKPCFIEAIESMTDSTFSIFKNNLMADHDFIERNIENMYQDSDGTQHCILALNVENGDGILIDASGYSSARYSAFVPNIKSYIAEQVYKFADAILSDAVFDGKMDFGLDERAENFGIAIREDNGIGTMFVEQLEQMDEVYNYEIEDGILSINLNIEIYDGAISQIIEVCNENCWLEDNAEYPIEEYPYAFKQISSASDLKDYFEDRMSIRSGVIYEDLAFVQQVNGGDEWLTFKREDGIYKEFESVSFGLIIENKGDDGFYTQLDKLLTKSIEQYQKQELELEIEQQPITSPTMGM